MARLVTVPRGAAPPTSGVNSPWSITRILELSLFPTRRLILVEIIDWFPWSKRRFRVFSLGRGVGWHMQNPRLVCQGPGFSQSKQFTDKCLPAHLGKLLPVILIVFNDALIAARPGRAGLLSGSSTTGG